MQNINPDLVLYAVGKMQSEKVSVEKIQQFLGQYGYDTPESIQRLKTRGKQFEDDPKYRRQFIDFDMRLNQHSGSSINDNTRNLITKGIGGQ